MIIPGVFEFPKNTFKKRHLMNFQEHQTFQTSITYVRSTDENVTENERENFKFNSQ
jgi:hypothetical protein